MKQQKMNGKEAGREMNRVGNVVAAKNGGARDLKNDTKDLKNIVHAPTAVQKRLSVTESPLRQGPSPKILIEMRKEQKLREEQENQTFAPKISDKSIRLGRGRDETVKAIGSSRFDALYSDARKRRTEGPVLKSFGEDHDLTFRPEIPKRSRSLSADRAGSPHDVAQRLHQTKGNYRDRKIAQLESEKEEVFKPTIPKRSSSLVRASTGDLHSRWKSAEQRKQEQLVQLKAEVDAKIMATCAFTPEICEGTRSISATRENQRKDNGTTTSANDRKYKELMKFKEDLKLKKEMLRLQQEEHSRAGHISYPNLSHTLLYVPE